MVRQLGGLVQLEVAPTQGIRTYQGSCRCGAVRFEADFDLSEGTTRRNCSYCTNSGRWGALARPAAFRLLAGEDSIVKLGTTPVADRPRCKVCGIESFGHGDLPELGGEYYAINVRCLDGVDLDGVPVRYLDGKHDTLGPARGRAVRRSLRRGGSTGAEAGVGIMR
jgi:hypothetical protein